MFQQQSKPKLQTSLFPKKSSNFLLYLLLGLSGLTLLLFFLAFGNRVALQNIQRELRLERQQTFVQLPSGESLLVESRPSWYRTDQVVKNVVEQWVRLTYEWDSKLPTQEDYDPGVRFEQNSIPTKVYLASYLLESNGFREAFLRSLPNVLPTNFFRSRIQGIVEVYSISDPRQIAEGKWEVDLVSVLIERYPSGQEKTQKYNRTFVLESRRIPNQVFEDQEETSLLRQKVFELATNGLIITDIKDLQI